MSSATARLEAKPRRRSARKARTGSPASRLFAADLSPLLALVAGLGLVMVALGFNAARADLGHAQPLFWGGLIFIYAPLALRLSSRSASRNERLLLSVLLGGALYLVKVIYSPTGFTLHDELATWLQSSDLLASGHALGTNTIVSGYAGFPGLELLSTALDELAGSNIFLSGLIVIGLARLLVIVALFLFFERAGGSARLAGTAIAIYVCNPSFLYFDSQYGYESLALVVAGALLLVAQRWAGPVEGERRWNAKALVAALAVLAATLALTHHMSSYAMTGFFVLWTFTTIVSRKRPHVKAPSLSGPLLPALLMGAAAAAWFVLEASHVTTSELGSVLTEAVNSVVHLASGESGSKKLFQSATQTNTAIARALGVASIVPLLLVIPFGLWRTWWKREESALQRALAVVALFFPLTLFLRLTEAGTETSQRASEFVYVGLAFASGLFVLQLRPARRTLSRYGRPLLGVALATVIFLGGFIVGESPVTRLPGPFLVGGEARATSPQGISAARFAASQLPAGSRVIGDRPNVTLMGSYGHLERVSGSIEGIPVARVFYSSTFDELDQRVISNDAIDYIVVDRRLSHEVPAGGFYFESNEPQANSWQQPISIAALRKFNHVRGLSLIFDNGAVAIYDTSGIRGK
jgi:hypothetical protein